jgi:hypothetical protein
MAKRGTRMVHIRADGALHSDADLRGSDCEQAFLFELPEENTTWKSLRSVSRKNPQPSSSESSSETESGDLLMSD